MPSIAHARWRARHQAGNKQMHRSFIVSVVSDVFRFGWQRTTTRTESRSDRCQSVFSWPTPAHPQQCRLCEPTTPCRSVRRLREHHRFKSSRRCTNTWSTAIFLNQNINQVLPPSSGSPCFMKIPTCAFMRARHQSTLSRGDRTVGNK